MMTDNLDVEQEEKQAKIQEKARAVWGNLDFLDELPDPPKRVRTPFPYGKEKPRPYGWFYK